MGAEQLAAAGALADLAANRPGGGPCRRLQLLDARWSPLHLPRSAPASVTQMYPNTVFEVQMYTTFTRRCHLQADSSFVTRNHIIYRICNSNFSISRNTTSYCKTTADFQLVPN